MSSVEKGTELQPVPSDSVDVEGGNGNVETYDESIAASPNSVNGEFQSPEYDDADDDSEEEGGDLRLVSTDPLSGAKNDSSIKARNSSEYDNDGDSSPWCSPIVMGACLCTSVILLIGLWFVGSLYIHPNYRKWNDEFAPLVDVVKFAEYWKATANRPILSGTDADKDTAQRVVDLFQEYGISNASLSSYWPYLTYPNSRSVTLNVDGVVTELPMTEPVIDSDPATQPDQGAVMTFLGYGTSGDVTGRLVYVNYGTKEDFDTVAEMGISLEGAVVLARYGQVFRGLKVQLAEAAGAAAVLIYSDPEDDGVGRGPTYPYGPWRHEEAVQRGSAQYLSTAFGDPLTPELPALYNATRLTPEQAPIPQIPALPLSASDARHLLEAMNGGTPPPNEDFVGYYPVSYAVESPNSTDVTVNVKADIDGKITEIWNAIGVIPGREAANEWVIIGCHHDTWAFGAADPLSGHSVLMETARVFGEMLDMGWKPRRTIVLASWSGEEYGLIGSTEWVEHHHLELNEKAVAYVNLDVAVSGNVFFADAAPMLRTLMWDTAHKIPAPEGQGTLYSAWSSSAFRENDDVAIPTISYMGSGSDFTPFFQWLGVTSCTFGMTGSYGTYHSVTDSIAWMEAWIDAGFDKHMSMVKYFGEITLRLAHDDILPFDPVEFALVMTGEANNLAEYVREKADGDVDKLNQVYPSLTRLIGEMDLLLIAAVQTHNDIQELVGPDGTRRVPNHHAQEMNSRLRRVERAFIARGGLYKRPYYSHVLFAPGLYKGYGATVFPAISEAADADDFRGVHIATQHASELVHHAYLVLMGEDADSSSWSS